MNISLNFQLIFFTSPYFAVSCFVFLDMLYVVDVANMVDLPSPELLQNKIIIKAKKFIWLNESTAAASTTPNNKEKEPAKIAEEEDIISKSKEEDSESDEKKMIDPVALDQEEQSSQMNNRENGNSVVLPPSQTVFLLFNQTLFGEIVYYSVYFLSVAL